MMNLYLFILEIAYGRKEVRYMLHVHLFNMFTYSLSVLILNFYAYMRVMIQIIAAHICYLVAEANFESYSDSARLCLVGADHWKFPRTYASPEAIQVLFVVIWLINLSFMKSGNFLIFCMLKWVL